MVKDYPSEEMKRFLDGRIRPAINALRRGESFGPKALASAAVPVTEVFPALMWLVYGRHQGHWAFPSTDMQHLVLVEDNSQGESILFKRVDTDEIKAREKLYAELQDPVMAAIDKYCGPKKTGFQIQKLIKLCKRTMTSDTQMIAKVACASFQDILSVLEILIIRKVMIDVKGIPCILELLFHEGFPIRDFHLRYPLSFESHG
jgi:hypothetical protein